MEHTMNIILKIYKYDILKFKYIKYIGTHTIPIFLRKIQKGRKGFKGGYFQN